LEDHLKGCAECRREAFYFSEIAASAGRLEQASIRPDFNVRLRAAIHRSEAAAARPKPWHGISRHSFLRPAMALGLLVITLGGGITGYIFTQSGDSGSPLPGQAYPIGSSELIAEGQGALQPGITPVGDQSAEDQRVQQYIESNHGPNDYVLETVSLEDPTAEKRMTQYVNPVITADQVARRVSY
jgi:hypothetical protein